jgi:hypothetical protein
MKAKTILFFALLLNCYVIQAQISKSDAPLNYALWGYVLRWVLKIHFLNFDS